MGNWKLIPGAVALILVIWFGYLLASDVPVITACSPRGFPGKCYRVSTKMCETIWEKAKVQCAADIGKLSLPPGRLAGPIAFRCQSLVLDRTFAHSRRSTLECDSMIYELHDWQRRNDF